jgi:hypothetical protein
MVGSIIKLTVFHSTLPSFGKIILRISIISIAIYRVKSNRSNKRKWWIFGRKLTNRAKRLMLPIITLQFSKTPILNYNFKSMRRDLSMRL